MAFLAAAPEAEAAAGAAATKAKAVAGKVRGKGKPAAGGRRQITPGMTPEETNAELQNRRKAAAEKRTAPAPAEEEPAPASSSSSSSSKAAPLFVAQPMDKWHTGSGLVLGSVAWVLFMNFMQGGMPQVRRWGAAKFLNRTPTVGGTK